MIRKVVYEAEVIITMSDKPRTVEFTNEEIALITLAVEQRINAEPLMDTEYGRAGVRLHIKEEIK